MWHTLVFAASLASGTAVVGGSSVNMRAAPSARADVVARLPFGAVVQTGAKNGAFTAIEVGQHKGFIATRLLRAPKSGPNAGDMRLVDSLSRPVFCPEPTEKAPAPPNCVYDEMDTYCGARHGGDAAARTTCDKARRAQYVGALERRAFFRGHAAMDARTGQWHTPVLFTARAVPAEPVTRTPTAERAELWTALLAHYEGQLDVVPPTLWTVPTGDPPPVRALPPLPACHPDLPPLPAKTPLRAEDMAVVAAGRVGRTVYLDGAGADSWTAFHALQAKLGATWALDAARGAPRSTRPVQMVALNLRGQTARLNGRLMWEKDHLVLEDSNSSPYKPTFAIAAPPDMRRALEHATLKGALTRRDCQGWTRTDTHFDTNGDDKSDMIHVHFVQDGSEDAGADIRVVLVPSHGAWAILPVAYAPPSP